MASCESSSSATEQPLQARVAKSHAKESARVFLLPQRAPHHHEYTNKSMESAYEAVKSGRMSIRRAAEEYGVPKSTLHDKVSRKVKINAKLGSKRYLTDEEEVKLVQFLVGCASIGYAKSRSEVLAIAQQIARQHDPKLELTKGWWDSFRSRHPEITLCHAEPLSYARATANNPTVIEKYFDTLEEIIHINGLAHRPGQIFNCDETGLPLSHRPPKVVSHVGQHHPYAITGSDKAQIILC